MEQITQEPVMERLTYQRVLNWKSKIISLTVVSDPNATIQIAVHQTGYGQSAVTVPGGAGGDLLVAMASAYTAATQGGAVAAAVADITVLSERIGEEWGITLRNPVSGFFIPAELAKFVLMSLQIMLNDATGEYRRQIAQIELSMNNGQDEIA